MVFYESAFDKSCEFFTHTFRISNIHAKWNQSYEMWYFRGKNSNGTLVTPVIILIGLKVKLGARIAQIEKIRSFVQTGWKSLTNANERSLCDFYIYKKILWYVHWPSFFLCAKKNFTTIVSMSFWSDLSYWKILYFKFDLLL